MRLPTLLRRAGRKPRLPPLSLEALELDAVRLDGLIAEPALLVFLIVGEVAFEPFDMALALEGQDVRREPIQEEAVMRNHDSAARKIFERRFESAERFRIEIVRRLVEQQQVAALLQELGEMDSITLTAR